MMFMLFCIFLQVMPVSAAPFLAHSKAVAASNAGDHAKAQQLLNQALVASPHDAALLYDAGVAEFKLGNHDAAAHYFEKAAQLTEKTHLQEDAWFNAGNARAHQKEYDVALENYQKILAQNPDHERARHNYDVVKKLKEQEEQQQDQQQNGDDNKQNKDDTKNQDQQQQNDQDSDANDDQGEDNKNDDQQDQNNGEDSKSGDDSDQSDDRNDQKSHNQKESEQKQNNQQKQNQQQQSSKPENQKQGQGDKNKNKSSAEQDSASQEKDRDYNNKQDQSSAQHAQPSEKKESHKPQSKASASAEQADSAQERNEMPAELEGADKQWMRCALEACDKQDTKHNKQLLKAIVGTDKGDSRAARSSW